VGAEELDYIVPAFGRDGVEGEGHKTNWARALPQAAFQY
jgi:hypothetical protein